MHGDAVVTVIIIMAWRRPTGKYCTVQNPFTILFIMHQLIDDTIRIADYEADDIKSENICLQNP